MNDLTARLLAEIERREEHARQASYLGRPWGERETGYLGALREVVELHREWPVLVTRPPEILMTPIDSDSITARLSQEIQWLTQQEYVRRFGSEPPTTPMVRAVAEALGVTP